MSDYSRAKIKEKHVLGILKKNGYYAELNEKFDENGIEIAQTFSVDGYKRSAPDINVYKNNSRKEVILYVEVKGFSKIPKIKEKNVLGVELRKLESYRELFYLSETEIKIIFVIGKNEDESNYEYFWNSLDNLLKERFYITDYTFDGLTYNKFIFWSPKSFNNGLNGFC